MVVDFGYGVDLSKAKFKPDAAQYVIDHFASPETLIDYKMFCEDNKDQLESTEFADAFVEDFVDDFSCASGLEAFLVRCINDNECDKYDAFAYDDFCIYVGARIPANDAARAEMLTMERIRLILAKYLSPLLLGDVVVEHLIINN